MTPERLVFDLSAAIAILFGGLMVVTRNAVRSVLTLVVAFFALAVTYVMLLSPFIAVIQVIVYAGAILVLFLFVLMLLNVPEEPRRGSGRPIHVVLSSAAIVVFAAAFLSLLRGYGSAAAPVSVAGTWPAAADIALLARLLFSDHLMSFEALSILLLAALVGAFALARRESVS